MGEEMPGQAGTRVLDPAQALASIAEAAALHTLDAFLERAVQVIHQRFSADFSLIRVHRHGRELFWAPLSGPLAFDDIFPSSEPFPDREDAARIESQRSLLTPDLTAITHRTAAQEALHSAGIRSSIRVALVDERDHVFGYVLCGALGRGAFSERELGELEEIALKLAWRLRPALLIEEQTAERVLLAEESKLLTVMAETESESDLLANVAEGVRKALAADLALVMVDSPAGRPAQLLAAPRGALTAEQWQTAREALRSGRNGSMHDRSRALGSFSNPDLQRAADTPLEEWMRDELQMRSLVSANRSHHWGGLGLGIALLRQQAGAWTAAEQAFLARISRVFELSIERLRRGEIAIDHTLRLEKQADLSATGAELLELLSSARDLESSCNLISARIREFFDADHVAFGMLDLSAKTRTVLGFSSSVMERNEFSASISERDVAVYEPAAISGSAQFIADLERSEDLNDAALTLKNRGIRCLLRAPFRLSDGSVGMVTVGSRKAGQYGDVEAERLLDLCRPVGIAIDRVRLLGSMSDTTALLGAKTQILAALGPGATVESAANAFVAETVKLFGATHSVVALFTSEGIQVAALASEIVDQDGVNEVFASHELDANWRRVLHQGESQVVPDLGFIERTPAEDSLFQGGLRCMMRFPITDSAGNVRGMVTAGSPQPGRWHEEDLATFGELSASLGLVFERAELYQRAEERSAKIQALTRLLSTLNLNSAPDEVARLFASQVREYLGADAVAVYAFDHEAGGRQRIAFDTADGATSPAKPFPLLDTGAYAGSLVTPYALFSASDPDNAPPWLVKAADGFGYASVACVRLDAGGTPVGLIAAGSLSASGMGRAELDILTAVAAPLGMVLERARAVTTLRIQTQRTRAVLDILAALGPAESIEQVAGPVANALRTMYGADHCAIGAIENNRVSLVAVDSSIASWAVGDTLDLEALWGEVPPHTSVVHVIHDLAAGDGELPEISSFAREGGMRSSMRVLVGTPADPLGVVTVGSRQPERYSEFDARQLAQIVQPLAVTARYFRGRRETELRTERLETTNRILTRLGAGGTPEHLARGFLAECRSLFQCRHAIAVQFDQGAGTGRVLALDTDFSDGGLLPTEFVLEEMHSARLLRQPTPQLVSDARNESALNSRHLDLIGRGVFSAIRAPLVVHDTVRGAVSLWAEGPNTFTAEDAELLGTLTRPLALALEKASALESLGESELKYRSLVAQADEMIFLFDPATLRLLDANAFTSQALGYSHRQLMSLTLDQVIDATREDIIQNVTSAIEAGELHLTDAKFLRHDAESIDVDAVASMVTYGGRQAVLVLARDVSERKALMRQLIQSQKMDSLGAMAGAVAHDFNNLLTTILGFAGLLKRSSNMDTEERENLALIEDAARRAADLTGRLLSFSRGGLVRFGRVDLRTVIEDTLQLAEPTMHAGLAVSRDIADDPVYVEGDSGQIQQALTNIILNARDAMPEGGAIRVSLAADGAVAVVQITDTGPGMDEETRMRIFEPFYTTKPAGSGTGLGMAITYGIIQGHHGDIAVQSALGQGTSFTISLPLLAKEDAVPADLFNAGEGNLVLVVDDDAMVRRTTTATLGELGYNVVEAPGGSTAVEILRARPDRFSVVLLDLVMPGMTGSETFRALTAIRSDIPVVVCTGYAADSHIDTDVKRRIAGLVQKPFTAERLSRALLAVGALPTRPARI